MRRRGHQREPEFGSDSFLDVTANLVGVLIILIVLVGLRVTRSVPTLASTVSEAERKPAELQEAIERLSGDRLHLERDLDAHRQALAAKKRALVELRSQDSGQLEAQSTLAATLQHEQQLLDENLAQLAEIQRTLVSLASGSKESEIPRVTTRKLVLRTPLSRPVESAELHFELRGGRISFIDVPGLIERVWSKVRLAENELRSRGRVTGIAGPVGPFRMRFTVVREDMPFTQSLIYGRDSFQGKLAQWQIVSDDPTRGDEIDAAVRSGSELDKLLARYSPNKYAMTLWTYPDSFALFRELRDHLSDRGYAVAARPLKFGASIGAAPFGSRSLAQ